MFNQPGYLIFIRWNKRNFVNLTMIHFHFLSYGWTLSRVISRPRRSQGLLHEPEFLLTPKFRVLLQIRSNWAKHFEFAPKFEAPRLGHQFCSLNGWKILSRSWDMTKWRCLQKTMSARTNFVTKCGLKLKMTLFYRPFSGLP